MNTIVLCDDEISEGFPHPFRHHIPPDARFQRKDQKVAETSTFRVGQNIENFAQSFQNIFAENKTIIMMIAIIIIIIIITIKQTTNP